jgi:hypothetical protein
MALAANAKCQCPKFEHLIRHRCNQHKQNRYPVILPAVPFNASFKGSTNCIISSSSSALNMSSALIVCRFFSLQISFAAAVR